MNQHAWDLLIKNHQWKKIWTKKISHWNTEDLRPSNEVLNKVGKVKSLLGWPNVNQSTHLCGCAENQFGWRYLRTMDTKEGGPQMWVSLTRVRNKHEKNGIVTK
jgi:hypothetical protein